MEWSGVEGNGTGKRIGMRMGGGWGGDTMGYNGMGMGIKLGRGVG